MKRLVFYCRWQGPSLRLRGRSETAVWGELVFKDELENETTQEFRFNLQRWELELKENDSSRLIKLDEMGTIVE